MFLQGGMSGWQKISASKSNGEKKISVSQRAISPESTLQGVGILCGSFIKTITITNRGLVK